MSPDDFDDIAALWQREPSPEEELAFQTLARRTSRRARWLDRTERGFAALLVAAVLIALLFAPRPATVAIGTITMLMIAWSSRKRHLLHQVKAMVDEGNRRAFVDAAVVLSKSRLRRSAIGLWLLPPSIILGGLLGMSFRGKLDFDELGRTVISGLLRFPVGPLLAAGTLLAFLILVRAHRRLVKEYTRLKALQADYDHEEGFETTPSD